MKQVVGFVTVAVVMTIAAAVAVAQSSETARKEKASVAKKVQGVNPVAMALEMQKALALSEEQVKNLQGVWSSMRESQQEHRAALEDAKRALGAAREQRQGVEQAEANLNRLMAEIDARTAQMNESAGEVLHEVLSAEQLQSLLDLIQEHEQRQREQPARKEKPNIHPVGLALELQKVIKLNEDQRSELLEMWSHIRDSRQQLEALRKIAQNEELNPDRREQAMAELEESEFHNVRLEQQYAEQLHSVLNEEQLHALEDWMVENGFADREEVFALDFIMEHREQLGVSPGQFTQLMYLQADFIRAIAPVREKIELLEIDVRERFRDREPPAEVIGQFEELERQMMQLREDFSSRAVGLLNPEQRQRLEKISRR